MNNDFNYRSYLIIIFSPGITGLNLSMHAHDAVTFNLLTFPRKIPENIEPEPERAGFRELQL